MRNEGCFFVICIICAWAVFLVYEDKVRIGLVQIV